MISPFFPPDKKAWASIVGTQPCHPQGIFFFEMEQENTLKTTHFRATNGVWACFLPKKVPERSKSS